MSRFLLGALAMVAACILTSFAVTREEAPQDSRRYVDALGRVHVTSGSPRGGAILEMPGNPGFLIDIRNWDAERSVRSMTAIAHKAYGFHNVAALIAMVYLCCTGIRLP